MRKELQEDFERWWVTATFQEKMSMGISVSLILLTALSMISGLLRPRKVVQVVEK